MLQARLEFRLWQIRLRLAELGAAETMNAAWPHSSAGAQNVAQRYRATEILALSVATSVVKLSAPAAILVEVTGEANTLMAKAGTVPPKGSMSESSAALAEDSVPVPRDPTNDALTAADCLQLPLPSEGRAARAWSNAQRTDPVEIGMVDPYTHVVIMVVQLKSDISVVPRVGIGTRHCENAAPASIVICMLAIVRAGTVWAKIFTSRTMVFGDLDRTGNPDEYFPP